MESAPNDNEFDDDGEKDSDRSKRRASNSSDRTVAVPREGLRLQPFKPEQEQEREKANLWRRLIGTEPESGAQPKNAERAESAKTAEPESASGRDLTNRTEQAEDPEKLPLTALSPGEEAMVLRRLVETDSLADEAEPAADEEPAVTEAIDHFHDGILRGDKTLPEAFAGTLAWLEGEEEPDDRLGTEQIDPALAGTGQAVPELPEHMASPGYVAEQISSPPIPPNLQRFDIQPNWLPNHPAAPAAEAPAAAPVAEVAQGYDKSDVVGAALVGGLVGYLIGRRRGRIKTEKRLVPVQKKLEKQVRGLQEDVKKKESVIREKAAEFARERQRLAAPIRGPAEKARERDLLRAAAAGLPAALREPGKSLDQLGRGHAEQPVALQPEQQHIGQVLVTAAEALPIVTAGLVETGQTVAAGLEASRRSKEQPDLHAAEWASKTAGKARAERAPLVPIDRHVETLSRNDLLELSSKIIVDGTTLKQAYESHQVGERALRRMVSEHLRGGDVREALRHEVVEHEIDFERDPQLRDQDHTEPRRPAQGGGGPVLHTLIQRADASMGGDDSADRQAVFATRAEHQAKRRVKQDRRHSHTHMVDAAMLAVIASLVGLIILLIIGHS